MRTLLLILLITLSEATIGRKGVTWSNGDEFNADDEIHNLMRWCDATVAGKSMATRLGGLVDP